MLCFGPNAFRAVSSATSARNTRSFKMPVSLKMHSERHWKWGKKWKFHEKNKMVPTLTASLSYSDVWCEWWFAFLVVGRLCRSVHFFRTIINNFGVQHFRQIATCHRIDIFRWCRQTFFINFWIRWLRLRFRIRNQHKYNTNTNHHKIIHFVADFLNTNRCNDFSSFFCFFVLFLSIRPERRENTNW